LAKVYLYQIWGKSVYPGVRYSCECIVLRVWWSLVIPT